VSERSTPLADARGCELDAIEHDKVYQADCVAFLNRVAELHPDGLFDLAFADPPYNLDKSYDAYEDALADQHYLEWCNQWLDGMARTLKPGGSLLVLNLPKWAMHHAAFLNARLEFRHWIAWDALSDPRGKLMPAHYALLYYTKPGGKPVFRYANREGVQQPDAPKYCLRAKCIKDRKARGDADKVELADVWFDIHRIRHKRDRDAHPCQLPEKLMERIIKLTTNPGGLVFDPFCGAGTTALRDGGHRSQVRPHHDREAGGDAQARGSVWRACRPARERGQAQTDCFQESHRTVFAVLRRAPGTRSDRGGGCGRAPDVVAADRCDLPDPQRCVQAE
jgi:DNA modification methylase